MEWVGLCSLAVVGMERMGFSLDVGGEDGGAKVSNCASGGRRQ